MKNLLLRGALVFSCFLCLGKVAYSQVDLYLDSLNVYVTEYGKIQLFTLPDTIEQLDRMSPLVGTGLGTVFDEREDVDVEDSTTLLSSPAFGDYQIYGSYNNNYSGLPPNVLVKENIYCWKNQNSIIVKYTVINRESSSINEVFGLELIPQVSDAYAGTDTVTYNTQTKIFGDRKIEAVGFKLLSGNINSLNTFIYYSGYNNDTTFWNWLTNGTIDTSLIIDPTNPNVDDPVIIPSFNSKTIAVGDSAIYYVALGYGHNNGTMLANMQLAQQKYNIITSVKPNTNNIPLNYSLNQNYPNPFNPSTKISYQLPKSGYVTLKVYNSLGKEVATLVNEEKIAGKYAVDFSAQGLSSGIYFYSIRSDSYFATKKMILLK
jgi:hypothetical protein